MNQKKFKNVQDMSAFLTHEINTPLTYMKGNLELMTHDLAAMPEGKLKKELLHAQKKLLVGIKRIENVVNIVHSVTKD